MLLYIRCAAVVELADAPDSKSGGSDTVSVRLRPAAPTKKVLTLWVLFFVGTVLFVPYGCAKISRNVPGKRFAYAVHFHPHGNHFPHEAVRYQVSGDYIVTTNLLLLFAIYPLLFIKATVTFPNRRCHAIYVIFYR